MVLQKCEELKVQEFIQKQLEKVPTAYCFYCKEIPYDLEGVYTAWAEKFVPIQELEDQTRRNYVKH